MGGIGWLGSHLFILYSIQQTLELLAASFMFALGLYISGWWQGLAKIERWGGKVIWKRLEPLGRRFMPVTSYQQAFFFRTGMGLVTLWSCVQRYYLDYINPKPTGRWAVDVDRKSVV